MNTPNVVSAEDIYWLEPECEVQVNDKWVRARPVGFQGIFFFRRLKVAWKVFTGKYDALKWEGQ